MGLGDGLPLRVLARWQQADDLAPGKPGAGPFEDEGDGEGEGDMEEDCEGEGSADCGGEEEGNGDN